LVARDLAASTKLRPALLSVMSEQGCTLLCPSAPANSEHAVVLGAVLGTPAEPRVSFFAEPIPVTEQVLELALPASPTEVFRFAAPCAEKLCSHFDGETCRLVSKIVHGLPEVVADLPICRIRPSCRWWAQEGRNACLRCPQVVTLSTSPSDELRYAADPNSEIHT
jgi:hypothetical protein